MPENSARKSKNNSGFRISLRTLFLLLTIAGLCLVVWKQKRDLDSARQELNTLKEKGGLLEITDDDRIHVVRVSSWGEPLTWRWRIFVPPSRTATLHVCAEDIPEQGFPEVRPSRSLSPGEQVVTYSFRRNDDGSYVPACNYVTEDNSSSRVHRFIGFDGSWLQDKNEFLDQSVVGLDADSINAWLDGQTLILKDDEKFALLRLRKGKKGEEMPPSTPGFLVWIEDTTNE